MKKKKIKLDSSISETTRQAIIQARRGHGVFKKNVKEIYCKCFLTDIEDSGFLIASHIKPWSKSNNKERLDGNNGLLLLPHIDHLFDKGFISFTNKGELLISDRLSTEIREAYQLSIFSNTKALKPEQKKYMTYHRNKIFK